MRKGREGEGEGSTDLFGVIGKLVYQRNDVKLVRNRDGSTKGCRLANFLRNFLNIHGFE